MTITLINKMNPSTESLLDQLDGLSTKDTPKEDDAFETITVQFSVNTRIPKESDKWTTEQKQDLAKYLASYSTRCVGEFQKLDWGCGAFMTQAFQDPENPNVIRAHVTAIDKNFVFSSDDYTREKFIEIFGQESFNNLKRGWPRRHASTLHEKLINFDCFQEPKIVEI